MYRLKYFLNKKICFFRVKRNNESTLTESDDDRRNYFAVMMLAMKNEKRKKAIENENSPKIYIYLS